MPTATEQNNAAQADLVAKRNAAAAAQQILGGLIERAESGEPVTDAEIAGAARDAKRRGLDPYRPPSVDLSKADA